MSTNRFDDMATTWDDDPAKVERAKVVARAIREAVPLDRSVRMLEYGAGTGLVTQALRDAVGPVTLVDTSAGMRDVIEQKIATGAINDARVWDVDFAAEPPSVEDFDLVVTVMALHHVADEEAVLSRFADLLVERGHVCIVDLEREDGSFHGADFDGHHGFDRAGLASILERVGFTDVTFEHCHDMVRDGVTYPLFLATATKRGIDRRS
ncbi:MAG TPA: class I SAM-dependent methyltransferase [Acidimicrobiia bacterium]|nr:class I SAM-dependent methyltransferase [Acidimicrobiia bacterium]